MQQRLDDVTMGLTESELKGLVVGVVFGSLFLITCIISAVKAVRDRRRILDRIAAKKAARTNGHVPKSTTTEKRRPPILIIHDDERAERITGSTFNSRSRSGSPHSPHSSILSTPGVSRHTETTFAEMAYNHNDPEEARDNHQDEDNAQRSTDSFPNGHCRSDDRPDSHLNGWVTRWQPDRHGRDSNRNNSSSTPDIPQRWRMGVIAENGSACNSVVRNGRVHDVHERSRETEFGVSSSSSFHGFSKHNNDSQVGSYPPRKEYVCAKYNPRRNSYAAAIANPSWIELPPLRRHSDDSHHVASCSRAQNCVKNPRVRERGRSQDGADNPAFDSADDSVAL